MTRATAASGSVTRKTEPHSKCSSRNPETQRSEGGDRAAERRPQRDRARPGRARPQGRDQGQRRRVGHAGGHAADDAGDDEHLDRRREGRRDAGRDRQQDAEDEHQLAAVAVAQRAEPQDRRRQPERVADGHQVERRLGRVECLADVGQGDVGDRQVQVRDGRHEDEREQDELAVLGTAAGRGCGRSRGRRVGAWVIGVPSTADDSRRRTAVVRRGRGASIARLDHSAWRRDGRYTRLDGSARHRATRVAGRAGGGRCGARAGRVGLGRRDARFADRWPCRIGRPRDAGPALAAAAGAPCGPVADRLDQPAGPQLRQPAAGGRPGRGVRRGDVLRALRHDAAAAGRGPRLRRHRLSPGRRGTDLRRPGARRGAGRRAGR